MANIFIQKVSWSSSKVLCSQTVLKRIFRITHGYLNSSGVCCANFGTYSQNLQRRKRVQDQSNVEFMEDEIKKYEMGRRWLAKMMGADVETFTDSDVEESLQYLLPTKLFAKDARPLLKHPSDLYPESKGLLSSDGRPVHPAFYTGATAFHDLLYDIFRYRKMGKQIEENVSEEEVSPEERNPDNVQRLATITRGNSGQGKLRWLHQSELEAVLGEELTFKTYEVILHRLKTLAAETNQSNADEIKQFLGKFQTPIKQEGSHFNIEKLDENGKARANGYRKRAMAEAWISNGSGKIIINDTPLIEYFCKQEDRNQVWHPFIELDRMDKFDVECNVIGGGTTGQAGAIRLAISRALTSISSDFLKPLQKAGLLTRDSRFVERKKPGQKKARKKFAWVRR